MTPKRALDLRNEFKRTVIDIYSSAVSFRSSHATILDDMDRRIYKTPQWQAVPHYVRAYIAGYRDALATNHYQHLEWRMMWRGKLTTAENILPGTWHEIDSDKSRHVYKANPNIVF